MTKTREFWVEITRVGSVESFAHSPWPEDEPLARSDNRIIKVREVRPELDTAIEDLVDALKCALDDMQHCRVNKCVPTMDECNNLKFAITAYRKAMGEGA